MDLGLPQGKPGEDGDDGDDGISPTLRLTEQGIEVSYDKGSTWSLLVPISEFHVTNNITNEYINNPDEEDITVVDDKLKFNDKEYNISEFSGLGRVYLRKNIVNGKNILAYNAFNSSSTIYHIQYDYDLDGRTVVVPNNCILLFEGGSLSNGTIVENDTVISAQLIKIFNEDISLDGAWKINGISYESGDTVFDLPLSAFNDLDYIDSEGYNYKYVIVLFHNDYDTNDNYHCFYEFPMVDLDGTKTGNNGNMNLFRFVACKNTTMCFKYYDTPDLVALDATDSVPITNIVTEYTWRGSSCRFLKGGDFSNFTGKFDFSYITFVKNVSNISQFQIQGYGQQHSVETLIAILDGLIDTTASPKSQGVGNSYNLRKLQANENGLAAIARAEAKGWTITGNV